MNHSRGSSALDGFVCAGIVLGSSMDAARRLPACHCALRYALTPRTPRTRHAAPRHAPHTHLHCTRCHHATHTTHALHLPRTRTRRACCRAAFHRCALLLHCTYTPLHCTCARACCLYATLFFAHAHAARLAPFATAPPSLHTTCHAHTRTPSCAPRLAWPPLRAPYTSIVKSYSPTLANNLFLPASFNAAASPNVTTRLARLPLYAVFALYCLHHRILATISFCDAAAGAKRNAGVFILSA